MLQGKCAIVTGASRGIGRAVATRFAREGARVLLACRSRAAELQETERLCVAAGGTVHCWLADMSEPGAADRLFAQASDTLGPVDILVYSAAIARDDLLALAEDDAVRELLDTNVYAAVALTRAAVRAMLRRRSGVVLLMSSVTASKPGRGASVYAGTKGFIEAFTRATAAEVGRKGIRVDALAPGVVETEMNTAVRAAAGAELLARIAQRRFGTPDDIAGAAAWLASDDAAYVTGAVIAVDGGFGLGW